MYTHNFLPAALLVLTTSACAGGEISLSTKVETQLDVSAELRSHYASRQAYLTQLEKETLAMAEWKATELSRQTAAVRPVQDKYGDPMYTFHGPLVPEPGTPMYEGPRYGASFDWGFADPRPDNDYKGYVRGRFSHPGIASRSDTTLRAGATQSYMQHGMRIAPGMMAPSIARVMINNY